MARLTPSFNLYVSRKSRYQKKKIWTEKIKCLHCSGHRVGTINTCLSPVRLLKIEILKKKILDRKTKILASFSGYRDGTFNISLSPVLPPEIEISKVFWIKKRKCLHPIQVATLIPLSSSFYRCNLQKSRYRRKNFLDEKTKMLASCSGHRVGTVDASLSPVRPPEIEISKKIIWTVKRKWSHCLGHRVSTVDTSLLPMQPPEIEILKKYFFPEKRKWSHPLQGTALVRLTPPFYLYVSQKSRYRRKNFKIEKQKYSHPVKITALARLKPFFHLYVSQKLRYRRKNFWKDEQKCLHAVQGSA